MNNVPSHTQIHSVLQRQVTFTILWPYDSRLTVWLKLNNNIFYGYFYHVWNVIQACEFIEADGKMPQSCEAGNLLNFTQTVAMKIQHLEIRYIEGSLL